MKNERAPGRDVPRALGAFSILCIGVNATVGSGIFRMPGQIHHYLGGAAWFSFALVGVMLVFVGYCFVEMAGMIDENGGAYAYAREAFGRNVAFLVGWMAWLTMVVSWAAVANGVTGYAATLVPALADPLLSRVVVALLVIVPGALNYVGVKPGAYATNIVTVAKLLPLALFVIVGFPNIDWSRIDAVPSFANGIGTLGTAVFVVLFAIQGFEVAPAAAGETRNAKRAVPIAVLGSLVFSSVFYVLIQLVASGTAPTIATSAGSAAENPWSTRPLAEAAQTFLGSGGTTFMSIGAVISMTGFCFGSGLATPRLLAVLATDRQLPPQLTAIHTRFFTPYISILVTTAVVLIACQVAGFDELINIANIGVTVQYLVTCLGVIYLRRVRPDVTRPYRVPFGPYVVPVLGVVVCLLLFSQAAATEWIASGSVAAFGITIAFVYRRLSLS